MADQFERTRDALDTRFPLVFWRIVGREVGTSMPFHRDGVRMGSLRLWLRRVRGGPGWVVRADLDHLHAGCIPVETTSSDPVDAVGVVLRRLASSARNEGWTILADAVATVADELATVEADPNCPKSAPSVGTSP